MQLSLLWHSVPWTLAALPSPASQPLLNLGSPLGSAYIALPVPGPGNPLGQRSGAIHRAHLLCFPSLYPSLSMSSDLKVAFSYILFIFVVVAVSGRRIILVSVTPSWLKMEVLDLHQL